MHKLREIFSGLPLKPYLESGFDEWMLLHQRVRIWCDGKKEESRDVVQENDWLDWIRKISFAAGKSFHPSSPYLRLTIGEYLLIAILEQRQEEVTIYIRKKKMWEEEKSPIVEDFLSSLIHHHIGFFVHYERTLEKENIQKFLFERLSSHRVLFIGEEEGEMHWKGQKDLSYYAHLLTQFHPDWIVFSSFEEVQLPFLKRFLLDGFPIIICHASNVPKRLWDYFQFEEEKQRWNLIQYLPFSFSYQLSEEKKVVCHLIQDIYHQQILYQRKKEKEEVYSLHYEYQEEIPWEEEEKKKLKPFWKEKL